MADRIERVTLSGRQMQQVLAKHERFWRRGDDSLLRSAGLFAPSAPVRLAQSDGSAITRSERLTPDMVDPAAMAAEAAAWDVERIDDSLPAQGQFMIAAGLGEQMPISHAITKIPWLEAMLGCPVKMTDGQIWSEPYEGDPEEIIARGANFEHNPWLDLYCEFLRQAQAHLAGRFPVTANTLFRGTCDLVAAVLGVKEAAIAWLDDPMLVNRLMRVCTDANLAAIEAGNKILKPFAGGYLSGYAIWTPAPVVRTQADHSTLLSPRIYEQQILPYDREVISSCPYSVLHLHNPGLHVAPALVQVAELSAIEVVVDPYPQPERRRYEVQMYQMIQQHKPLILDVGFPSVSEADALLSELSPRGLAFNARFDEATLAALPRDYPGRRPWFLAEEKVTPA
jgi:hypothetical protein